MPIRGHHVGSPVGAQELFGLLPECENGRLMACEQMTRKYIREHTVRVLRPGEKARPDVRLVSLNGRQVVVKDYASNGTLFKRVLGAYLVWRERMALERAAGLDGVPQLAADLGPYALVTEYMDATEVTAAPPHLLDEAFFERLSQLIGGLHRRGIVHGDLKNLGNILVTDDGRPRLVDLTSAFITGSNPCTALLFPFLSDDDHKAILKLKKRCAPHLLSAEEEATLEHQSSIERGFRWVRKYVRYAVKVFATPEHERSSISLK